MTRWSIYIFHIAWFPFNICCKKGTKTSVDEFISVIIRFMIIHRISQRKQFSTITTGKRDPTNMICLDMVLYILHPSLFSTHLTYPCLAFSKWISVITVFHHRLHLLVQIFKIRFVCCVIHKRSFIYSLCKSTLKGKIFFEMKFLCSRIWFGEFWLRIYFVSLFSTSNDLLWVSLVRVKSLPTKQAHKAVLARKSAARSDFSFCALFWGR